MLDRISHQGQFGEDYVRALATAAGLLVASYNLDRLGIDLGIRYPGLVDGVTQPGIDAQVKSWSIPRSRRGFWLYDGLSERQFNRLAGDDYTVPRYLFLIVVPRAAEDYARFSTDGMTLCQLGFYTSLHDRPRIADPSPKRQVKVEVPVGNVLTTSTLRALVHADLQPVGAVS